MSAPRACEQYSIWASPSESERRKVAIFALRSVIWTGRACRSAERSQRQTRTLHRQCRHCTDNDIVTIFYDNIHRTTRPRFVLCANVPRRDTGTKTRRAGTYVRRVKCHPVLFLSDLGRGYTLVQFGFRCSINRSRRGHRRTGYANESAAAERRFPIASKIAELPVIRVVSCIAL